MKDFNNNDKYIYKRKDFLNAGVPEGSFNKLMKDLKLDTPEYCTLKRIKRNVKAKFYTAEAFEKVLEYQRNKEKADNRNEIPLIQKVNDLTKQIILIKAQNEEEKGRLKDTIIQQMKELQNEKDKNVELRKMNKKLIEEKEKVLKFLNCNIDIKFKSTDSKLQIYLFKEIAKQLIIYREHILKIYKGGL